MNLPDDKSQPPAPLPDSTAESQASRKSSQWMFGLIVALIGGLLLARNLGYELFFLQFDNWWAFLILFAALGPLHQALRFYRKEGMSAAVINSLVFALAIVFTALLFLLDLAFTTWWPVFVILFGLSLMSKRNT